MLHPRHIRYARQSLLFACIWLTFGLVYSFVEQGILGRSEIYPSTNNRYDFESALIYSSLGAFLMGFVHGWIEVSWLSKKFRGRPFWIKIVLKTLFYSIFIGVFLVVFSLILNSYRFNATLFSHVAIDSVVQFVQNFSFWSVMIYVALGLFIALVIDEMSTYMGRGTFLKYLFGNYHNPKRESRIFMFLDMKSSTTIAEELGHAKFFRLLRRYYADMADPILETSGEVYQYVGDEIVVTWPEKLGLENNNCIACFTKIVEKLHKRSAVYEKDYGLVPKFKAGYHMGMVTTGEIGVLKKQIIYSGDVLNTAARIQGECNNYGEQILLSEQLVVKLKKNGSLRFHEVAELRLRGKNEQIKLFSASSDYGESAKTSSI